MDTGNGKRIMLAAAAAAACLVSVSAACLLISGITDAPESAPAPPQPASKPERMPGTRLRGRILFLVDSSGSMRIRDQAPPDEGDGAPVSRFDTAVLEVLNTLESLAERGSYRFDAAVFGSRTTFLGRDRMGAAGFLSATRGNIAEADRFLRSASVSGPTLLREAIVESLDLFSAGFDPEIPDTIFLYTDGVPTLPPEEEIDEPAVPADTSRAIRIAVKEKNVRPVKIDVFALGSLSSSREFLMALASDNGGISMTGRTRD